MWKDIGEAMKSEVAKQAYKDGLASPLHEVGGLSTDLLKTLRLFLAPFQLTAIWQDRLSKYLDEIRSKVPEERQIDSPASVAGPILSNLRFIEEENPLKNMYLSLLSKSIDRDKQSDVHPAFIKILEQLSPFEVLLLEQLAVTSILLGVDEQGFCRETSYDPGCGPFKTSVLLSHLRSLNVASAPVVRGPGQPLPFSLTNFGRLFLETCKG